MAGIEHEPERAATGGAVLYTHRTVSARPWPTELTLTLGLDDPDDEASLRARAARRLQVRTERLPPLELLKRSIDARHGRVRFRLLLRVGPKPSRALGGKPPRASRAARTVAIVGAGPAGLFCAYQLARRGIGSTLLERGRPVSERGRDVRALGRGVLEPESNYCFGEGGAGTYSDGKLYTRSHERGCVRDVLELLVLHGAPVRILTDARPHIGSDLLPGVVRRIRERLEAAGVEFRFGARLVDLVTEHRGGRRTVCGVRLADGGEVAASHLVLATGHSARDVYELLARQDLALAPKPFAVGVRIEHPQALVDRIQYGCAAGHPRLSAATYRVATQVDGCGVYSFCMCPGGFVVPAATEPDGVVMNGMSLAARDSPYANSGIVVSVDPVALGAGSGPADIAGLRLQRRLERLAFAAGGGAFRAPATRLTDFVAQRGSTTLPAHSYAPGLVATDVGEVLDAGWPGLASRLRQAVRDFDARLRGYLTEEAVVMGVETRTSSAVRVVRDPATLQAPELVGLYPCGEGAGHAGGIMSSAVDGMRVAECIAEEMAALTE